MAGEMVFRPRLVDRIQVLLELFLISHIYLACLHKRSLDRNLLPDKPSIRHSSE